MSPIAFPLKLQMQGPRVADLQDALRQALDRRALLANDEGARGELLAALGPERGHQTYGDVTAKLVAVFQGERHLPRTGEVDEPTANAINALLREWGLLVSAAAGGPKLVTGAARREDGTPIAGVLVRAAHQAGLLQPVGEKADRVVVLGMHHDERAGLARDAHHVEHFEVG